jgi:hypothetical protein
MVRVLLITFLLLCFVAGNVGNLRAQETRSPIGMVKSVTGAAYVVRDGRRIAATPGFELVQGDRITTGSNGTMGILLRDETALSLGNSTDASIENFAFEPKEQKLGMVLRVARGLFCYLSGKIAKLAPDSVRIETPVATLGVRGTYFVARIVP